MAKIEIEGDVLTVHVTGIDQVLAFKHSVTIPLAHVVGIDKDAAEAGGVLHGIRMPGTSIPGVITAGSFLRHGEWSFWDVHDPENAVVIRLQNEHYSKVVVGVDDPNATIEAVSRALAGRPSA